MNLIHLAAGLEAATGLLLIISPSAAASLVFGADLTEPGSALGRLAGIALLSFAVACWPAHAASAQQASGLRGLLTYNLLATIYFLYVGVDGQWVGPLLWPVVGLHAILTTLIIRRWFIVMSTVK